MTTVGQLLRVGQVAVAPCQIHHERLRVVEGGGLVVQAVRADRRLHHVELLQLGQEGRDVSGGAEDTYIPEREEKKVTLRVLSVQPVVRGRWPGRTGAAGRRSPQTHCPKWRDAGSEKKKSPNNICVCLICVNLLVHTENPVGGRGHI